MANAIFFGPNGRPDVTAGGVVYADGTRYQLGPAGVAGQVLQSNGALAPTWGSGSAVQATNTDTGTKNDWAPGVNGGLTVQPWAGASDITVTGLSGLATGAVWIFKNTGTHNAFFKYLNGGSTATHQFANLVTSGDTPVAPGGWVMYVNDGTNLKMIGHDQGAWLSWSPAITPNTGTYTGISASPTIYKISGKSLEMIAAVTGTAAGSPVFFNLPNPQTFTFTDSLIAPMYIGANGSGVAEMGYCQTSTGKIIAVRLGNAVWGSGTATWYVNAKGDVD